MIKEFAEAWSANKDDLEQVISESKKHGSWEYGDLLKLLFEVVINPYCNDHGLGTFNLEDLVEIDHGSYSGTLVFVLHRSTYPDISDYIYTSVWYGSCSGCDVLQAIQADGAYNSTPNEQQVKDYLGECLHLLEACHHMKEYE